MENKHNNGLIVTLNKLQEKYGGISINYKKNTESKESIYFAESTLIEEENLPEKQFQARSVNSAYNLRKPVDTSKESPFNEFI